MHPQDFLGMPLPYIHMNKIEIAKKIKYLESCICDIKSEVDGDLVVNSIQFLETETDQSKMYWDEDEETLSLVQNTAILQLGQESQIHVRNNSGADIGDGTVVMATGTLGASGRITVAPYDGVSNIKYVLGVATYNIADGEDGKITNFGKVRHIDTSGTPFGEVWNDGDVLYVSSSGELTNVEPVSGIKNSIAYVINAHTNGTIMVRFTPIDENALDGVALSLTTVNAATYDLQPTDAVLHVTYTGTGAVTNLRLMSDQVYSGRTVKIKDAGGNATTNNITITTEGAETIDGQATWILGIDYESVEIYSDGTNWFTI